MVDLGKVLSTVQKTIGVLTLLEPVLGDTPYVKEVLAIVARVASGAATGKVAYETLVGELEAVNAEMEAVRAKGPVTGDDLRDEVAAITAVGNRLDALLARLEG